MPTGPMSDAELEAMTVEGTLNCLSLLEINL